MSDGEQIGRCWRQVYECGGAPSQLRIADAIDRLAADVAAVKDAVCDIASDELKHFVEAEMAWVALVTEQRDEATRKLDEARAEVERLKADGKQAPDDLGVLQDARGLSERCKELASRIAMQKIEARAEKLLAESSQQQPPAAPQPAAPEPAYYLVTNERDRPVHVSRMHPGVGWDGCTITALYVAPQPAGHGISPKVADTQPTGNAAPAAGWLTEREQHALRHILAADVEPVIRSILARAGSPPVVEVPAMSDLSVVARVEAQCYRDAMDKAGVSWKEVPRE